MPTDGDLIAHVDFPLVGDEELLPRDPIAALDKLSQLNGSSARAGSNACGAVSLVAATLVVHGYAGLQNLAEKLREELADETHAQLMSLANSIAMGDESATYGALADYAILIYRRYRGMDGGIDYRKLVHLMKLAGFEPPRIMNDDNISRTITQKGQCWPAKIALFGDEGDHWILVGRDIRGLFIYDPYPREDGSQLIRPGEADWKRYVDAVGRDEEGKNTIGFLPET